MRSVLAALTLVVLAGCASPGAMPAMATRVDGLLGADAVLLGEQHDAPDHQRIHLDVVQAFAARSALAALALEMAPQGGSTHGLSPNASESAVQAALRWGDASWPWAPYAPAVMAAVRAGVPVLGANLPRAAMRAAMADEQLDALLPGAALKAQREAIRTGHCELLPETQIAPMARIQIARDRAIARTVADAVTPGKTVVLLAGASHLDRGMGVPLHLPAGLRATAIALRAGPATDIEQAAGQFDATWATPAIPPKDYCAELRRAAT